MPLPDLTRECSGCLEFRPLMPVRIYPGSVPAHTLRLCLACRLDWQDSKWACLASTLEHSVVRQWKAGIGGGIPPWFEKAER